MTALPVMRCVAITLIAIWMQAAIAHTDIQAQLSRVTQEINDQPGNVALYLTRGELKRHTQDWHGAEADFAMAQELGSAEVRDQLGLYRGRLFEEAGMARRAVEQLDGYISRHPEHIDALRIRALAYAQTGTLDKAIADYTRLIALDTARSPELWLERARLWIRAGQVDAAVMSIDEAITEFGPLVTLVEFTVNAEIGRHEYAKALNRIETLPAKLAETPEWLWRRGGLLEQLDRPDDAARVYARAREAILDMPMRRQKTAKMQDLLAKLSNP